MKKNIKVYENGKYVEKQVNYIPMRYIVSILMAIFEIMAIIAILVVLALYIPYFYISIYITVVVIILHIIGGDENPDYKIPWLVAVIALPIVGMMLYFIFSKRKLPNKIIKKLEVIDKSISYDNHDVYLKELKYENELISSQALNLTKLSKSNLYKNNYINIIH